MGKVSWQELWRFRTRDGSDADRDDRRGPAAPSGGWEQLLWSGAAPRPQRCFPQPPQRSADTSNRSPALSQPGPQQDGGSDGQPSPASVRLPALILLCFVRNLAFCCDRKLGIKYLQLEVCGIKLTRYQIMRSKDESYVSGNVRERRRPGDLAL